MVLNVKGYDRVKSGRSELNINKLLDSCVSAPFEHQFFQLARIGTLSTNALSIQTSQTRISIAGKRK